MHLEGDKEWSGYRSCDDMGWEEFDRNIPFHDQFDSTVGIPTVQVESYLKYGSSILRLTTTACTAAVIRSTSSELVPDYLVPYNACDQIPAQPPLHMVSTVCVGIFPVVHETLMNLASQTVTKDVRSGC